MVKMAMFAEYSKHGATSSSNRGMATFTSTLHPPLQTATLMPTSSERRQLLLIKGFFGFYGEQTRGAVLQNCNARLFQVF
jgi:hypothetical protein